MSKKVLLGFIPWILYLVLSSHNLLQFDIAIVIALIASLIFQAHELKKGFIFSWGTLIFFLFMTITVVLMRNLWVIEHAGIISNSGLAVITLISLVIGKPFTMQYARETTPPDKWQDPLFIRTNYLLSTFWLVIFLSLLGVYLVQTNYPHTSNWIFNLISVVIIIFAAKVSIWFPDWYKKRYSRGENI